MLDEQAWGLKKFAISNSILWVEDGNWVAMGNDRGVGVAVARIGVGIDVNGVGGVLRRRKDGCWNCLDGLVR